MAFLLLLVLSAIPPSSGCNAHAVARNRAKVVEDYVVSANLDNSHFPQLQQSTHFKDLYHNDDTPNPKHDPHIDLLQERDLLIHHHHLPPPPHPHPPPPPHPPPAGLLHAPSVFAIGLITFLILLNSLQTSLLLILKSKGSLLGSVAGAVGRRKRSLWGDMGESRGGLFREDVRKPSWKVPKRRGR